MMLSNPQFYMDKMSPKALLRILPNQGHGGVWGGWDAPRQLWNNIKALLMIFVTSKFFDPQNFFTLKNFFHPQKFFSPQKTVSLKSL